MQFKCNVVEIFFTKVVRDVEYLGSSGKSYVEMR
jgi:hypothetical protein